MPQSRMPSTARSPVPPLSRSPLTPPTIAKRELVTTRRSRSEAMLRRSRSDGVWTPASSPTSSPTPSRPTSAASTVVLPPIRGTAGTTARVATPAPRGQGLSLVRRPLSLHGTPPPSSSSVDSSRLSLPRTGSVPSLASAARAAIVAAVACDNGSNLMRLREAGLTTCVEDLHEDTELTSIGNSKDHWGVVRRRFSRRSVEASQCAKVGKDDRA